MSRIRATPRVEPLDLGLVQLPDSHPRSGDGTCLIQGFLIHHPDGFILVDTGVGSGHELINELYDPTVHPVIDVLNTAGVDERDVVAIVNTHLHFDHCGQNAALPNAAVYVQEAELEASRIPAYTVPEWAHIDQARQRILSGDETIAAGVKVLSTPGHTPGHQSVLVGTSGEAQKLIVGQCCYSCGEFEAGTIESTDMHDPTFLDVGFASLDRLRRLAPAEAYFSHDPVIHRTKADNP